MVRLSSTRQSKIRLFMKLLARVKSMLFELLVEQYVVMCDGFITFKSCWAMNISKASSAKSVFVEPLEVECAFESTPNIIFDPVTISKVLPK